MARKGSNGDQQIGQGGIVWTNEKRRLGDLIPWPRNPRQIKKAEARRLVESVDEFGQVETLAIGPGNDIYNGHQRLNVLMAEHGPDLMVDVRVSSRPLSEKEREKLTVLLHRGAAGSWDFDLLANEFDADELIEWGFEAGELGLGVDGGSGDDAEPQLDRAEELRQVWGVEPGQLWRLPSRTPGQFHMLICGDCTDAAVVGRVMGGEKFTLCATSPPYSDLRTYEIGEFDWDKLMNGFSCLAFEYINNNASVVVNLGPKHTDGYVDFYWHEWLTYCKTLGYPLFGMYVWAKLTGLPGNWNGRPMPSHEFIFHFKKGQIQANKWVESTTENTRKTGHNFRQRTGETKAAYSPDTIGQPYRIPYSVFVAPVQHPTNTADNEHPARFSEEFVGQLIRTWSNLGELVYEPFLGSGTTLIAAENLGRQCRAVEISPGYCAVALQRYLDTFGIRGELAD